MSHGTKSEPQDLAQARLAAIIESSDDAIISKTLDGIVTSWNRAAESIFGFTAEEAVGRSILLIIPDERRSEEESVLARLRRGEKIDHFETVRRAKDGHLLDVSITVSPIKDHEGRIVGASKVARDITERKRAELERQQWLEREQRARQQAERALQARDEFLATVSHELRSPLNAIVGWAHLLQAGGLDRAGTTRAIETISRNAAMQNQLISDILDVQRLTSGRLRLAIREMDLPLVLEGALDTVRPAAMARRITIVPCVESLPWPVTGDPDRIQQVVWNLVSNAVKFANAGGTVVVGLKAVDEHVEISVEDDGPGIKAEFLPYVFERFRQETSSSRRPGGLGLGLAIVRHLVELHGGTVTAGNRESGPGAIFAVHLPRASRHVEAVVPGGGGGDLDLPRDTLPSLHGMRVLVVDDEADAREVVAAVLARCGADVTVASSADEALSLMSRVRPDVLVSDISMPGQDGYALLRAIRSLSPEEGGQTPALALTAATTLEDRLRVLRAGFQFYLAKPVDPFDLASTIAGLADAKAVG